MHGAICWKVRFGKEELLLCRRNRIWYWCAGFSKKSLTAMRDAIADAFEAGGERHEALLGAVALALDFGTWRTLVRQQGLEEDRAVELMVGMVRCLMRY
jgi:hypothetical protein